MRPRFSRRGRLSGRRSDPAANVRLHTTFTVWPARSAATGFPRKQPQTYCETPHLASMQPLGRPPFVHRHGLIETPTLYRRGLRPRHTHETRPTRVGRYDKTTARDAAGQQPRAPLLFAPSLQPIGRTRRARVAAKSERARQTEGTWPCARIPSPRENPRRGGVMGAGMRSCRQYLIIARFRLSRRACRASRHGTLVLRALG